MMNIWLNWKGKRTMAKAKNFRELQGKMPADAQARVAARVKETLENMALDELRAARELTQQDLAQVLHVNQAAVSKLERRTDMYVGTLSRFIEAMGGHLEIRAVFPDGAVRITQFAKAAAGSQE
jgi:DNA-binding transcriptional regulator YiaG